MMWQNLDTWIVVVGALAAVTCALPGCFLLLRGMSMMGDAISHAVLPGLALAFLLTGSRSSLWMFVGAAIVGVLTALFTQWISDWGKVERGASMGIVFTSLFALGLLLIVQAADRVDLDPACVLYGALELTPLDSLKWNLGETWTLEIPRAAIVLGVVLLLNSGLIALFYKELKLSAFDPELADTLGFGAARMHYLLMTMVAVTTVAAFEAVGSILVIAMLTVPPATAFLLTRRLSRMLVVAIACALLCAPLGHLFALWLPAKLGFQSTGSAPMMAVAAGLFFGIAWIGGWAFAHQRKRLTCSTDSISKNPAG